MIRIFCIMLFLLATKTSANAEYFRNPDAASSAAKKWNSFYALPDSEQLKSIVSATVDGTKNGALIIGFTDGQQHHFYAYGKISAEKKSAPKADTIFEIGSITKIFTSLLLADLWRDNKLSFDDSVEKFLTQDHVLPKRNGKKISLFQLSTHSSGMPRDPDNLKLFAKYGNAEFHDFLSRCQLNNDPGKKYSYSNAGYRLLGEALEAVARKPYEEALNERILTPMQLKDTRIVLPPELISRMAQGYDEVGKEIANAPVTGGPAGGLKSSAEDLLRLLDACILPQIDNSAKQNLNKDIRETCKRRFAIDKDQSACLGWLHYNREDIYAKNGQIHGFGSYLEFSARKRIGIVVLASTLALDAEAIGKNIRQQLNLQK